MDMQAAPPTYAEMNTGQPPSGNPPMLGQQVPGFSGGLPSQGGLSVLSNPMAQELQSQYAEGGAVHQAENVRQMGRGEDSVLMHVTPHELSGLQALAMAHGGSLTINPHTGLPEAGFLGKVFKKLLPTLVGVGLNFIPGVGPLAAAALTAAGGTAATGSLKKGLMAGLQAYGGASLATGLGAGVDAAKTAATAATGASSTGANVIGAGKDLAAGAMKSLPQNLSGITAGAQQAVAGAGLPTAAFNAAPAVLGPGVDLAGQGLASLPQNLASVGQSAAGAATKAPGFFGNFAAAAREGLPAGTPKIIAKAAPLLAAQGLMSGVSGAFAPSGGVATPTGQIDNSYQGPYYAQDRQQIMDPEGPVSGKQRRHFAVSMPEIRNTMGELVQPGSRTVRGSQIMQPVLNPKAKKGQNMYSFIPVTYQGGIDPEEGYARGGEIAMDDGAFVLDARTVSELGNGSSNAGKEVLRRIGGMAIEGPGDGVSDSVRARIGRDQPARVARDEVVIPAKAVKRIGQGNPKRGADKLYALMDKAHKARKNAKRGQDTKLRRGLAL